MISVLSPVDEHPPITFIAVFEPGAIAPTFGLTVASCGGGATDEPAAIAIGGNGVSSRSISGPDAFTNNGRPLTCAPSGIADRVSKSIASSWVRSKCHAAAESGSVTQRL